ncbi:glycine cleavage system aminomethyltransferase GcvT [bacterium]|nr:glycine cleavage system aminomethyltransferase GcvT [bacterium]MDB4797267.1 glycine cleavage system aminomethyltransferase GcvT [bacterium]
MKETQLKRTPLFDTHNELDARMVEFGGWEMPVLYSSIAQEHHAVRQAAGLFDISHMGEFLFDGPDALKFLNQLLTNDLTKLEPGQGQYTLLCQDNGGVIDDLYAYRLSDTHYLLIVNASRLEIDWMWIKAQRNSRHKSLQLEMSNPSGGLAAMALQGPKAAEIIAGVFPTAAELRKNQIAELEFAGATAWVSRTGYTGEDGFELVVPNGRAAALWEQLMSLGQALGLLPAGLGARDTLRTEAGYSLYGHELTSDTTPIEAALGWAVALDKPCFNGREMLAAQKKDGVSRLCIAFKMTGKSAPPREQYKIFSTDGTGREIGEVTSGTQSPSLGCGIGLGYVESAHAKFGTDIEIEIRNRRFPAQVVKRPIFQKSS